jgi:hypothetical protein
LAIYKIELVPERLLFCEGDALENECVGINALKLSTKFRMWNTSNLTWVFPTESTLDGFRFTTKAKADNANTPLPFAPFVAGRKQEQLLSGNTNLVLRFFALKGVFLTGYDSHFVTSFSIPLETATSYVSAKSYPFAVVAFRVLAHRAFCAIEIFRRAAADNLLPSTLAPRFAPFSKASIRCSIFATSVISE